MKMFRRRVEIVDAAQLMTGNGIDSTDLQVNWPDLMAHKRSFNDAVPESLEAGI